MRERAQQADVRAAVRNLRAVEAVQDVDPAPTPKRTSRMPAAARSGVWRPASAIACAARRSRSAASVARRSRHAAHASSEDVSTASALTSCRANVDAPPASGTTTAAPDAMASSDATPSAWYVERSAKTCTCDISAESCRSSRTPAKTCGKSRRKRPQRGVRRLRPEEHDLDAVAELLREDPHRVHREARLPARRRGPHHRRDPDGARGGRGQPRAEDLRVEARGDERAVEARFRGHLVRVPLRLRKALHARDEAVRGERAFPVVRALGVEERLVVLDAVAEDGRPRELRERRHPRDRVVGRADHGVEAARRLDEVGLAPVDDRNARRRIALLEDGAVGREVEDARLDAHPRHRARLREDDVRAAAALEDGQDVEDALPFPALAARARAGRRAPAGRRSAPRRRRPRGPARRPAAADAPATHVSSARSTRLPPARSTSRRPSRRPLGALRAASRASRARRSRRPLRGRERGGPTLRRGASRPRFLPVQARPPRARTPGPRPERPRRRARRPPRPRRRRDRRGAGRGRPRRRARARRGGGRGGPRPRRGPARTRPRPETSDAPWSRAKASSHARAAGATPGSARKSRYGGRACRSSAPRLCSRTGRSSCARTTTSTRGRRAVERATPRKRTGVKPGRCTSSGSAAEAAAAEAPGARPASVSFTRHHALRSFQKKLISIAAMRSRAAASSARVFSRSARRSSNESWLKPPDCRVSASGRGRTARSGRRTAASRGPRPARPPRRRG